MANKYLYPFQEKFTLRQTLERYFASTKLFQKCTICMIYLEDARSNSFYLYYLAFISIR